MEFCKNELRDLFISVVTITLAFYIILLKLGGGIDSFFVVFLGVGVGFVVHEMAHKFTAIKYGCIACYKMWTQGLVIALLFAILTGFVFAAPGAVYIYKQGLTRREDGIISLAGPLANLLTAAFFLFLFMDTTFQDIGFWIFKINVFLGFFNMIPFGPLDGSKVFRWNTGVWGIVFVLLLGLYFFF